MNTTVLLALGLAVISATSAIAAPIFTLQYAEKQRKKRAKEEKAERAVVATQAAEAAELLLAANERVAASSDRQDKQLRAIHGLVNSNLTKEKEERLIALEGKLVLMDELIDLRKSLGQRPTDSVISAREATVSDIAEVKEQLTERKKTQDELTKGKESA